MKVVVFSAKPYEKDFLSTAGDGHEFIYVDTLLTPDTAALAKGAQAICVSGNDQVSAEVLRQLKAFGVGLVTLRSAGYNNVDLAGARAEKVVVANVPAYSPQAIAEYAAGMVLSLSRHIHHAYGRVREGNFSLQGLLGFNLHGRVVGVVGTGHIGACFAKIMAGFGCEVLAHDRVHDQACIGLGVTYVTLAELLSASDIVSLHCPLTPDTHHLIDAAAVMQMKRGVMLINTSRGGVVDTQALVSGIKSGAIGYLGLDVYEDEAPLFFEDRSGQVITDDLFERLLTFPNVLVTGHQAFFTHEAMTAIAETTVGNISAFEKTGQALHQVP